MKKIIVAENKVKVEKEMTIEQCVDFYGGAIRRWANDMFFIVKGMSNNLMEYDDFHNEGMICLIHSYNEYESKNTFNTFLHKNLDNLKIDLIRKLNAKKRKTKRSVVSFDMEIEDDECDSLKEIEGIIDDSFEELEFNLDMEYVMSKLSDEEIKIFKFLIDNESTKRALAKELKISRPTLDNKILKVKDKVIGFLPEYILY